MGSQSIDLNGKKFGKLLVVGRTENRTARAGTYWDCLCDCGEAKPYRSDLLRKGLVESCGCTMNHIKVGDNIGNLVVVKKLGRVRKGRSLFWRCRCNCGSDKDITLSSHALKDGHTRSCGCLLNPSGKRHPNFVGYGDMPGGMFKRIEHGAKNRKISFSITKKQIWDLFEKQNRKCALSGMTLQFGVNSRIKEKKRECTASVDRVDNTKGYVKGNIQWVHKDINKMKNTHSQEYFIKICNLVSENVKI